MHVSPGCTVVYRALCMFHLVVPLSTGTCACFTWLYRCLQGPVHVSPGCTVVYRALCMFHLVVPLSTGPCACFTWYSVPLFSTVVYRDLCMFHLVFSTVVQYRCLQGPVHVSPGIQYRCSVPLSTGTCACFTWYSVPLFSTVVYRALTPELPSTQSTFPFHRLVGLVVKASVPRVTDLGSRPALAVDLFSRSSHTSDFKFPILAATLPGVRQCRVSTGTGWPGVNTLLLG